jgi:hypothetical protein
MSTSVTRERPVLRSREGNRRRYRRYKVSNRRRQYQTVSPAERIGGWQVGHRARLRAIHCVCRNGQADIQPSLVSKENGMRLRLCLVLVTTLMLLGSGLSFAAESVKSDRRGDAAAAVDITRVTYINAPTHVSARIHVPGLLRHGRATLDIALPATDTGYLAVLEVRPDGSLDKRFRRSSDAGTSSAPCHVRGRWDAARGIVTLTVPQACVKSLGGGSLYLQATTGLRGHHDYAPSVSRLARG